MADKPPQREWTEEELEVQRSQMYAAIQAVKGRSIDPDLLRREAGLITELSGRSMSLRSRYGIPDPESPPTLAGSRSLSNGPITDRRGLGQLAPYVIPGLLRKASMQVPDDTELSALRMYSGKSFSFNDLQSGAAQTADERPSTTGRLSGKASWEVVKTKLDMWKQVSNLVDMTVQYAAA